MYAAVVESCDVNSDLGRGTIHRLVSAPAFKGTPSRQSAIRLRVESCRNLIEIPLKQVVIIVSILLVTATMCPANGACLPAAVSLHTEKNNLAHCNASGCEIDQFPLENPSESILARLTDSAFNSIYAPLTKVVRCAPRQFLVTINVTRAISPLVSTKVTRPLLSPLFLPRGP